MATMRGPMIFPIPALSSMSALALASCPSCRCAYAMKSYACGTPASVPSMLFLVTYSFEIATAFRLEAIDASHIPTIE